MEEEDVFTCLTACQFLLHVHQSKKSSIYIQWILYTSTCNPCTVVKDLCSGSPQCPLKIRACTDMLRVTQQIHSTVPGHFYCIHMFMQYHRSTPLTHFFTSAELGPKSLQCKLCWLKAKGDFQVRNFSLQSHHFCISIWNSVWSQTISLISQLSIQMWF